MHKVMEEMYAKACVTENSCLSITCQWWQSVCWLGKRLWFHTHTHTPVHRHTNTKLLHIHAYQCTHWRAASLLRADSRINLKLSPPSFITPFQPKLFHTAVQRNSPPPIPRPLIGSKAMKHKYSKTPKKIFITAAGIMCHMSSALFFPNSLCPAKLRWDFMVIVISTE